jgi:hypothetical protein
MKWKNIIQTLMSSDRTLTTIERARWSTTFLTAAWTYLRRVRSSLTCLRRVRPSLIYRQQRKMIWKQLRYTFKSSLYIWPCRINFLQTQFKIPVRKNRSIPWKATTFGKEWHERRLSLITEFAYKTGSIARIFSTVVKTREKLWNYGYRLHNWKKPNL